jgi:hypothetical protein
VGDAFATMVRRVQPATHGNFEAAHHFLWYLTRQRENSTGQNVGCYVEDAFKVIQIEGVPGRINWPDSNEMAQTDPRVWQQQKFLAPDHRMVNGYNVPQDPFYVGKHHRGTTYRSVACDATSIKLSLANNFPVSFGVLLYSSFGAGPDGNVPLPNSGRESQMGGHCMVIVGYREDGSFIVKNSWGTSFGDGGYIYLPPTWFDAQRTDGLPPVPNFSLLTWHALAV